MDANITFAVGLVPVKDASVTSNSYYLYDDNSVGFSIVGWATGMSMVDLMHYIIWHHYSKRPDKCEVGIALMISAFKVHTYLKKVLKRYAQTSGMFYSVVSLYNTNGIGAIVGHVKKTNSAAPLKEDANYLQWEAACAKALWTDPPSKSFGATVVSKPQADFAVHHGMPVATLSGEVTVRALLLHMGITPSGINLTSVASVSEAVTKQVKKNYSNIDPSTTVKERMAATGAPTASRKSLLEEVEYWKEKAKGFEGELAIANKTPAPTPVVVAAPSDTAIAQCKEHELTIAALQAEVLEFQNAHGKALEQLADIREKNKAKNARARVHADDNDAAMSELKMTISNLRVEIADLHQQGFEQKVEEATRTSQKIASYGTTLAAHAAQIAGGTVDFSQDLKMARYQMAVDIHAAWEMCLYRIASRVAGSASSVPTVSFDRIAKDLIWGN